MAVDDVHPSLWREGRVVPAEEFLLIDPQGSVENRFMRFEPVWPDVCLESGTCSDFPIFRAGTLTLVADLLRFDVQPREPVDRPAFDAILAPYAVTSVPAWFVRLSAAGQILVLDRADASGARRVFARTDLLSMQRLRAGFLNLGVSAMASWRCFLGHAFAAEPAFAPIARGDAAPPEEFDAYLRGASYLLALADAAGRATADDADPKVADAAAAPLQSTLIEPFPDIALPTSVGEKKRLVVKLTLLRLRLQGLSAEEAARELAGVSGGESIALGLTEGEIAALARVDRDPALRRMLDCGSSDQGQSVQ
jgi:hypothetical protein